MKRIFPLILGLALSWLSLFSACAKHRVDITGSWQMDAGIAKVTMVFSSDGAYTETLSGMMAGSITGTWRIEGDELVQSVKVSTLNEDNVGKEFREKIISATSETLTLSDTDGKAHTYIRLK